MQSIMIVEDNDDLRMLYRMAMEQEGYEVLTAPHGKDALDQLRQTSEKPRLILLDLMMPIMDGHEFLRVRAQDPGLSAIPVVVCSASREEIPGQVQFLKKPVDLEALLRLVGSHCRP